MRKNIEEILSFISGYFEKNVICDGLVHFGSSVKSNKFRDIDLLCYFKELQLISHFNILKSLYFFKEKYPNINFSYNEMVIGKLVKNKVNFSFISFGKGIKKYSSLRYSISKSYRCLFGVNPIKNAKMPSKKECLKYSVMIYNIKRKFPRLQLKSFLSNALLARKKYVTKKELIQKFEKEYKTKLSKTLKDLFYKDKIKNSEKISLELKNLHQFILMKNNFIDNINKRIELLNDSPIVKFRIKVFNKMNQMISKDPKEKVLSYLEKKQKEYERLQGKEKRL
ncbi:MAG: hypothetical protein AABW49_04815 [Nanoarchaeota archaeon]